MGKRGTVKMMENTLPRGISWGRRMEDGVGRGTT